MLFNHSIDKDVLPENSSYVTCLKTKSVYLKLLELPSFLTLRLYYMPFHLFKITKV